MQPSSGSLEMPHLDVPGSSDLRRPGPGGSAASPDPRVSAIAGDLATARLAVALLVVDDGDARRPER